MSERTPREAFYVSPRQRTDAFWSPAAFRRWFLAREIAYHGEWFAWELVDWDHCVAPRLTRFLRWLCRD